MGIKALALGCFLSTINNIIMKYYIYYSTLYVIMKAFIYYSILCRVSVLLLPFLYDRKITIVKGCFIKK